MPEENRGDSTDCSAAEYELIRREEVANLQGSFTWDFGQQFFIEKERQQKYSDFSRRLKRLS